MNRVMACLWVFSLVACSDDGLGSGASEGGSGTGSASNGDASNGEGTTHGGTSADGSGGPGSAGPTTDGESSTLCEGDDDCLLVNDCCSCAAIHVDDPMPPCDLQECFAPTCDANGMIDPQVWCRFGTCEFVPLSCSPFLVACDEAPPECGEGTVPSVVESCWGPCVPASACDVVPSCDDCPDGEACIETSTQLGWTFSCEPIDPSCDGTPDCTCMGVVCEDPFECVPAGEANGAALGCGCPTCGASHEPTR